MAKPEFLVINIGGGVHEGASATIVGVTESMDAAKDLIRAMRGAVTDKVVVAEKKIVVTRAPVVELKESDESVLARAAGEKGEAGDEADHAVEN